MKVRYLMMAFLAAAVSFVSCEQEEDPNDYPAKVEVSPAEINFEQGDGTQEVQILSTRNWTVKTSADWVTVATLQGDASVKPQSVSISVLANAGYNREATVTFSIGLAKAHLTVKQAGPLGEYVVKLGSGTKEDPFTVAGVFAYVEELGADVNSPKKVYVKGKISKLGEDNKEEVGYSAQYGNGSFRISDGGESSDSFYAYRIYYLGNKKFTSSDTDVKVGDEVVIYGTVVNYKGNTPETVLNQAFLYELNGVNKGGDNSGSGEGTTAEAKGTGTQADPFNVAAAIAKAKETGETATSQEYYIKGKIAAIADNGQYNAQYGNATFDMVDEGFTAKFVAYRILYFNNQKWTAGGKEVKVNDEVIICAKIVNYKGNTPETSGGYLYSLNGETGGGTTTEEYGAEAGSGTQADPYNVAKAHALAAALDQNGKVENVYVKGKISALGEFSADYGNYSYTLVDNGHTGTLSIYRGFSFDGAKFTAASDLQVNDEVVLLGTLVNYKGNTPQVTSGSKLVSLNGKTQAGPSFGVEKTEISVAASATSATIKVTGNVAWTATSTDATVAPASGEGAADVTVTFAANTSTEAAKTYKVTLATTAEVATKSIEVVITQAKVSTGGGSTYVLDKDAIKAAHTEGWTYSSGTKNVTATDGSVWTLVNTYASTGQVTVQMNKGKSAYVLTPAVPDGKEVKKISVVLNKKSDGTGDMGDRPLDILNADGSATLLNDVTGQALADGIDVAAGHSQLRIICDETNGGAVYITSITVTFGNK